MKLILDDQDSYTISLESFKHFRGPLFRKPVIGQELFAVSYSKPALVISDEDDAKFVAQAEPLLTDVLDDQFIHSESQQNAVRFLYF